ncbi:MAG TPA: hypothetical protein VL326_31340 [Kofleriaceae bacterium]|nr:hypothetical protein [Kofleriaceae bacterium]
MFDNSDENTTFEPMPLGARQRVVPGNRFKAVPSKFTDLAAIEESSDKPLVTELLPALPPTDHQFVTERVRREPVADTLDQAVTNRVPRMPPPVDEHVIETARVPRLPPPPSSRSPRPPLPPHILRTNVRLTAQSITPPPIVNPVVMPVLRQSRLARLLSRFGLPIGGAMVVILLALYLALPGRAHGLSAAANRIAPLGSGSGETPSETFQLTSSVDQPPDEIDEQPEAKPVRTGKSVSKRRPRKILAVDASTPLGNLRPRKSW